MSETSVLIERSIELTDPLADTLRVLIGSVIIDHKAGRCEMRIELESGNWKRVWADGLFHLGPEVLCSELRTFDDEKPVGIELELTPIALRVLLAEPQPESVIASAFSGEQGVAGYLSQTQHWRALTAAQQIELPEELDLDDAIVELGVTTIWAKTGLANKQTVDVPASPTSISATVQAVLAGQGFSWDLLDSGIYRLCIEANEQRWMTLIHPDEEHRICVMTSILPENVAESRRAAVVIALAAPNYEMGVGSFDLDPKDGELRYRTGVDLGSGVDSTPVLEALIRGHLQLFTEQYEWLAGLTS